MLKHLAVGSIRHAISLSRCRFLETVAITTVRTEMLDSSREAGDRKDTEPECEYCGVTWETWQDKIAGQYMNHYELSVRVGYCGLTWETWQDKIAGQYMNHYELSVRVLRSDLGDMAG
ncbi:hypothetical protein J6590_008502 [Homalodisca vitripennis]|nr:hypothetical protein J6590_008502 [Homalodisca vitripennis]